MELRVLGPVELAADGRRLPLASARRRCLLAVLLAGRGEVVSTDRLIDAVWGATPPASARGSLHSHVSRLRGMLAAASRDTAEMLVTEPDGYRLALAGHDLDAARFEAEVAAARARLERAPRSAVDGLDAALARWRGAAYGELAEHELIRPEAVRLEELRASALADRVDARLALGEHRELVGELQAAVAAAPLAERPAHQLIRALAGGGRPAEALAVFRDLRRRLAEELGLEPSAELQRLHQHVLRRDPDLGSGAGTVASAGTPSMGRATSAGRARGGGKAGPPDADASRLVGRVDDVAAVAALVAASAVVTVTGPGGVGKTRLAEAVVEVVAGAFEDGVVWCPLAGLRDPDSVGAALVAAAGLQQHRGEPAEETLFAALGSRRVLLVLDNAEHLLAAVSQAVAGLRGRCPNVATLVTSREYLRVPGERVWDLAPLGVPSADADRAALLASPAGELLCARAGDLDPTFAPDDADVAALVGLCRRLDGLPLALELAAARLRALSAGELSARLDERFAVLTGGPSREGGRHRTLQALVDWSYARLPEPQARLFDRLSVFAGPFSLTTAEQVCAGEPVPPWEVAGVLADLVDQSLVRVERRGSRVRYRLLDTLRAYGGQRLEASGASARVRRAHAHRHVRLAEELAAGLGGPGERDAVTGLDEILDDLRVAHAWLVAAGETDGALRLPVALHDDLVFRPRGEPFAWVERALELPGAPRFPVYPAALATAARGAMNQGRLDRARRLADAALAAASHHEAAALPALYVLTTVALYEGDLDRVLVLADRRLALADALGHDLHRSLAGVSRALALRYRGEATAAAHAAVAAHRHAEASGSDTARAWASYAHGEALLDTDPKQAARLLEGAVDAARHVDRRFIEGVALVSLASLHGRTGRTERALALFRDAIVHWRPLGAHTQQLTTLRNLVELLVRLGADQPAAVLHGAVTAGSTPTFGAEAERLAEAWQRLEERLGGAAAADAASRGRGLHADEVVDLALAEIDALRPAGDG